jgi:serine O-acetyltransferase
VSLVGVRGLLESYAANPWSHRFGRGGPSRAEVAALGEALLELLFPGCFSSLALGDIDAHVVQVAGRVRDTVAARAGVSAADGLLAALPEVRRRVLTDVEAAFTSDPAARSVDEVMLAYPGLVAIAAHRCAHVLWILEVPLLPRMIGEWAHSVSGADLHPGAKIGAGFFLDHATGCVIGETAEIGQHARLFQGVTIGALSFPRDGDGALIRGTKRHPTLKDDVTVYANATILGGETVIGTGVTIGASAWVTASVPDGHRVVSLPPEQQLRRGDRSRISFDI